MLGKLSNEVMIMKINFILPPPLRKAAGGYKVVYQYANYLSNNNDVNIYYDSRKGDNSLRVNKYVAFLLRKIICNSEPRWFNLSKKVKKKLIWEISKLYIEPADITICTSIDTMIEYNKIREENEFVVHFIQGHENWFFKEEEVNNVYKLNTVKIVVSNWLKEKVLPFSKNDVYVVKNGVDNSIFFENKLYNRKHHSIAFMYSESKLKNSQLSIEVISELKKRYDDLKVTAFSVHPRNKCIPEWVEYIEKASEREVARILNEHEVFLCTSNFEGYGLPGLEAMACGCVLVSTDCKGVMEYGINKENSLISPIKDKDSLVKNIIDVFEDDILKNKILNESRKVSCELSLNKCQRNFEEVLVYEYEKHLKEIVNKNVTNNY